VLRISCLRINTNETIRGNAGDILETEKREKLKDHIIKKIQGLKEDIKSYQVLTRPVAPDNAIGRLTRMEAINSKSINEATQNKAKQTLSKMERTLIKDTVVAISS